MDKGNGRGRCVRERYDVKNTKSLGTICRNENYIVISVNKVSCSKINSSSIVHINHLFITQQIVKLNGIEITKNVHQSCLFRKIYSSFLSHGKLLSNYAQFIEYKIFK